MKKTVLLSLFLILLSFHFRVNAQSEFSSNTIQVGVVVSDLEKSVDFYTNVIGMTNTRDFDVNAEFGKISGLSNGVAFTVKVMQLANHPEATEFKLMSFGNNPLHKKSAFIQDDLGMQYITINVNSMKPFLERIKKYNVRLLGETPVPLGTDRQFILIADPDGTIIELIGPAE